MESEVDEWTAGFGLLLMIYEYLIYPGLTLLYLVRDGWNGMDEAS